MFCRGVPRRVVLIIVSSYRGTTKERTCSRIPQDEIQKAASLGRPGRFFAIFTLIDATWRSGLTNHDANFKSQSSDKSAEAANHYSTGSYLCTVGVLRPSWRPVDNRFRCLCRSRSLCLTERRCSSVCWHGSSSTAPHAISRVSKCVSMSSITGQR